MQFWTELLHIICLWNELFSWPYPYWLITFLQNQTLSNSYNNQRASPHDAGSYLLKPQTWMPMNSLHVWTSEMNRDLVPCPSLLSGPWFCPIAVRMLRVLNENPDLLTQKQGLHQMRDPNLSCLRMRTLDKVLSQEWPFLTICFQTDWFLTIL